MNDNLISLIIPVYNSEKYLKKTLDSVRNQSYRNFEVILVDDGSTDNSPEICDEYGQVDARFHVFHIKNGGVSHARNFALSKIHGQYCAFLDSDDLLKPLFMEVMLNAAVKHNANIVTCRFMEGNKYPLAHFENYNETPSPSMEVVSINEFGLFNKYQHLSMWAALFKSSLFTDMSFDNALYEGEDAYLFAQLLCKTQKLIFVDDVYYYYSYSKNSLTHRKFDEKRYTHINALIRLCELFEKYGSKDLINDSYAWLAIGCRRICIRAIKDNFPNRVLIHNIYQLGLKHTGSVLRSNEITTDQKIKQLLFILFPHLLARTKTFFDRKLRKNYLT